MVTTYLIETLIDPGFNSNERALLWTNVDPCDLDQYHLGFPYGLLATDDGFNTATSTTPSPDHAAVLNVLFVVTFSEWLGNWDPVTREILVS
jgi:hypothetical protein